MEKSKVRSWSKRMFNELSICFCGYSVCYPGHNFGPAVRPNYILHYILSGSGEYHVNGCVYKLSKGQGFLIKPNIMTEYHADNDFPWTYIWIGFDGTRAYEVLNRIGINTNVPTFAADCGDELLSIIQEMLNCGDDYPEHYLKAQSDMYHFFACLAHGLMENSHDARLKQQNYYVNAAIKFIRENYAQDIKVDDIAKHIGISRAYLSTLFQKIHQLSPKEYLSNFRLTRAREQLVITDLPIGTISSMCGYNDPLVFSKAFKQQNHMTPTEYRRLKRTEQNIRLEHSQS